MDTQLEQIISSYGVRLRITASSQILLDQALEVARKALLGQVKLLAGGRVDRELSISLSASRTYSLRQDGVYIAGGRSKFKFFKFFDAMVRITVGESAPRRVFLHAGAVSWRGRAIIMPADSFQGKTTLVAELVRSGAEYLSDEFAVIDREARVHPFARVLTMRTRGDNVREYDVSVADLGGTIAKGPVPIGAIIFTGFKERARWRPEVLTPGLAVMRMIPFALSINKRPEFTMKVLNNVASRAIIASGSRGNAEKFAATLLNFVDKQPN